LPADCVLLFSASDLFMHRSLALRDGPLVPERQRAIERQLREIGRYAVAPVCRHRLLTEHFGAPYQSEGCECCDVCLGETKSLSPEDALLTAKKVLSAAWRTGGRFGTGYVVDLLLCRGDERMQRNGHDILQVFGLLKDSGEAALRSWVDQLIVQGFLEVTEERMYPLLRITEAGKALCRDEGTVRLGVPVPASASGRGKKRKSKALRKSLASNLPTDEALFERLRKLRRSIAETLGIPPYVVFHDSTLVEMAALKPKTLEALRGVKGVGDHKLKRYGEVFLGVIAGRPLNPVDADLR
jgi:ATP-dependent DNA helicase RecQ